MSQGMSTFACPGCAVKREMKFRKPTKFEPTVIKFVCRDCYSGVMLRVTAKGRSADGQNKIEVQSKLTAVSKELAERWHKKYLADKKAEALSPNPVNAMTEEERRLAIEADEKMMAENQSEATP